MNLKDLQDTPEGRFLLAAWKAVQDADYAITDAITAHAEDADPDSITPLDPILQNAQNAATNLQARIRDIRNHLQNKQS